MGLAGKHVPPFNESTDREHADWKRIRLVIEHENTLVHYRLTWLLTSQTVLFAALAFVVKDWEPQDCRWVGSFIWLPIVIGVLGFATSLLVWRGLLHAKEQIARVDRWWYCEDRSTLTMGMLNRDQYPDGASRMELAARRLPLHPPLQYQTRKLLDWILNPYNLPVCFMVAWIAILSVMWLNKT